MVAEPAEMGLAVEVADALQDMMEQADTMAASYRDPNIPEGALLGETELQGQQVKWKKPRSMVRSGNVPLPDRFEAFDRNGGMSLLPTAQMGRMLSKPRADSPNGERAFHTHTRGVTASTCKICPPPKTPIEQTCEFCLERTAGAVRKRFYSETDAYSHKTRLHPEEFGHLERTLDREERRAQIEAQQRVADAMLEMVRMQMAQQQDGPAAAAKTGRAPKDDRP